ncbi:MAG: D-glycerate dehydrogenase [Thermoanaerobacteraceae bacterium]|nr:D-glycerate dehydrogenase [Thermoanaerobacteraceae bacterium]
MFKILLTREIPGPAMEKLKKEVDLEYVSEETKLTKQEIIDKIKDKDGIISMLDDPMDAEVINAAPNLKVISNYAVGFNNIDVKAATARGIVVTNTPGVLTNATADLAWALLMATSRRIVEGDKYLRAGKFHCWGPKLILGYEFAGKTLGIIGMGRIGGAVAKRAKGFDMHVIYYKRHRLSEEEEKEIGAEYVTLDELLSRSDFISIHTPLTDDTRHMLCEEQFKKMKKNCILVNTARGLIIDEKALVKALKEGWIAGAGLDVYENEPEVTPELLEFDNVVLEPHIGSATYEARERMAEMVVEDCLAVLSGNRPQNLVNKEVYEK